MDTLFHPSAAETASGNTGPLDSGNLSLVGMFVNVTAASGTLPTLIVKMQHSPDGNIWYDIPGIVTTSLTGVIQVAVNASGLVSLADHIRCAWTIGGVNPSFTFTVDLVTRS